MTNIWNKLRFALPIVAGACLLAPLASARTILAVAGNPATGANSSCFNDVISPGVRNSCAGAQSWGTIVPFDTAAGAGVKRLIVRGSGTLSCSYFGTDLAGRSSCTQSSRMRAGDRARVAAVASAPCAD